MKGTVLQGLGPPPTWLQLQPPSTASPSRPSSFSSSQSHSGRPGYQLSTCHTTRQQVLCLETESVNNFLCSTNFRSSFHGNAKPLNQLKPSPLEKKFKDVGKLRSVRLPNQTVGIQSSNKCFEESHRRRGTFPSLGTQSTNALESKFSYSNIDQNKTQYLNPAGHLDQASSLPTPEVVQSGLTASRRPVTAGNSLDHRRSRVVDESTSDQRVSLHGVKLESSFKFAGQVVSRSSQTSVPLSLNSFQTSNSNGQFESRVEPKGIIADQAVRRSSESGALLPSDGFATPISHARPGPGLESTNVIPDQARNAQNGAHPLWNKYGSPSNNSRQWYKGPRLVTPNRHQVQPSIEVLRDQWKTQNILTTLQYRRDDQSAETGLGRSEESFSFQSLRHGNHVAHLEASPPQTHIGAAKWSEAAKRIEQNRRPAHKGGGIESDRQKSDGSNVELEPVGDFGKIDRCPSAHEVLQIYEPKQASGAEVEHFPAASPSIENSVRQVSDTAEITKLGTGAELQFQPDGEQQLMNADVLVVNSVPTAEAVVEKLRGKYKGCVHACDTEVAGIDVKKESPVGHGRLICFSIYCGPDTDFGGGKCRLWVDVLDKPIVLEVFKSYFEDPDINKVWHNYSFDKHILGNHGINAKGFYADTMHLARLYDSSRTVAQGGYSLEGLTSDVQLMGNHWGTLKMVEESGGKRSMKHLFGKPNVKKNGEEGKLRVVPPVQELQTRPEWRDKWIHYSSFDTVCTWCLWKSLQEKLKETPWMMEGKFEQVGKMYDFYKKYVRPFGELLVQMEAEGMMLDRDHLVKIEEIAIKQQEFSANQFRKWAAKRCPDAILMNVGSDAQIRQLLFGGKENKNDPNKRLEGERIFNAPNTENFIEEGRKTPKKMKPFTLHSLGVDIPVDSYTSAGWPAVGGAAMKALAGKVSIDYTVQEEDEAAEDLFCCEGTTVLTSIGVKGASEEDLSVYGKAYKAFGGGKEGKDACMAFAALCEVASINTLISNFIQPLQGNDIKGPDGRVHCSLNINTETGRLSARRPSLQNQPALEKDRYKIRQAFVAAPGNSLIVADYGQLELRILAHLANCKSMLKAFLDGGDFHSRTAMNMYPHVRNAVDKGHVILEWEPKPGKENPPVPLLKDVFGAERRKAKMLNFSIAYGKTAMGLAKDWKVSLDEAKSTVELWYSDRQEVRSWQKERIKEATKTHRVHTLLGRTRRFPDLESSSRLVQGHIERAAINTPVQGSAADVAMCAMLEISQNKILKDLGWKLLLQVHDEVILEGPLESAAVAKDVVVNCMGFPFSGKNILKVALAVDAKFAQSWYGAK